MPVAFGKVFIADDHKIFRDGLKWALRNYPGLKIIAEAENSRDLLLQPIRSQPDLIISGYRMPVMNGLEALKIIRKTYNHIKVAMITMDDSNTIKQEATAAGIDGFLLKSASAEKILNIISRLYPLW